MVRRLLAPGLSVPVTRKGFVVRWRTGYPGLREEGTSEGPYGSTVQGLRVAEAVLRRHDQCEPDVTRDAEEPEGVEPPVQDSLPSCPQINRCVFPRREPKGNFTEPRRGEGPLSPRVVSSERSVGVNGSSRGALDRPRSRRTPERETLGRR